MKHYISLFFNIAQKCIYCTVFFCILLFHFTYFCFIQCPTVYQEEMGRDMERSDQEQNNSPNEKSLIVLHKKVYTSKKACNLFGWQGCQT